MSFCATKLISAEQLQMLLSTISIVLKRETGEPSELNVVIDQNYSIIVKIKSWPLAISTCAFYARGCFCISVSKFCWPEVRICSFIHVGFCILCWKSWLSLEGGQFCFINLITFSRSLSPCTTSCLELIDMDSNSCLALFNQGDWGRDQVVWKHLPTCQDRRKYCPRSNVWKHLI